MWLASPRELLATLPHIAVFLTPRASPDPSLTYRPLSQGTVTEITEHAVAETNIRASSAFTINFLQASRTRKEISYIAEGVASVATMISRIFNFPKALSPGSLDAYGFGFLCFVTASLVRLLFNFLAPDIQSFATFYPAVLFSALIGGAYAGMLTLVLSAIFAWWAFLPPYFSLSAPTPGEAADLILFVGASLVILAGATAYRRILWRLEEEERFRKTTVNELAHRVKNNLATVYAILRRELRAHPHIWESVQGRLNALAATDEFVRNSTTETASFRSILAMEFVPYDTHRFTVDGPDVELTRKLAITVALIIHELATNAVKHGALADADGHVAISWEFDGRCVRGEWLERGGPLA